MHDLEKTRIVDALDVIVTDQNGNFKDARFIKRHFGFMWQFRPNALYVRLVNKRFITPNSWKILGLFGTWRVLNA